MKRKHQNRDLDDPIQLRLFTDQSELIKKLHKSANKVYEGITNFLPVDVHRIALDRGLEILNQTNPKDWIAPKEDMNGQSRKKTKTKSTGDSAGIL